MRRPNDEDRPLRDGEPLEPPVWLLAELQELELEADEDTPDDRLPLGIV